MLNISGLNEGVVIDHIKAGGAMKIYEYLNLEKLDCQVAIIKNARSNKKGKKDILKVECDINTLDLDVLAFIDHNITVNVIKDGEIVDKKELTLPKEIRNIIKCTNPRCITSIEQELPHIFVLSDEKKEIYRCKGEILLSSDSHDGASLGFGFDGAAGLAREIGFRDVKGWKKKGFADFPL